MRTLKKKVSLSGCGFLIQQVPLVKAGSLVLRARALAAPLLCSGEIILILQWPCVPHTHRGERHWAKVTPPAVVVRCSLCSSYYRLSWIWMNGSWVICRNGEATLLTAPGVSWALERKTAHRTISVSPAGERSRKALNESYQQSPPPLSFPF